ncbi:MAG: CU044_2847 family protein [Nostoc sp.]|uniref:CU044_2847 family protein n=1 Tax=Nostoc sp. TaxID=1180 RepID=UPI002FF5786C
MVFTTGTEIVKVQLPNNKEVQFEVTRPLDGKQDISATNQILPFDEITDAIEGMVEAIKDTLSRAQPQKASIKFGVKVGFESGKLTALIVKGSSEANLEITLEWSQAQQSAPTNTQ